MPEPNYQHLFEDASAAAARNRLATNTLLVLLSVALGCTILSAVLLFSGLAAAGYVLFFTVAAAVLQSRYGIAHERLRKCRNRAIWFEKALDRVAPAWRGDDEDSERFADLLPLGEDQLGIFGAGSLFDRVSTCKTEPGRARLAAWLARPASSAEVRARQGGSLNSQRTQPSAWTTA